MHEVRRREREFLLTIHHFDRIKYAVTVKEYNWPLIAFLFLCTLTRSDFGLFNSPTFFSCWSPGAFWAARSQFSSRRLIFADSVPSDSLTWTNEVSRRGRSLPKKVCFSSIELNNNKCTALNHKMTMICHPPFEMSKARQGPGTSVCVLACVIPPIFPRDLQPRTGCQILTNKLAREKQRDAAVDARPQNGID